MNGCIEYEGCKNQDGYGWTKPRHGTQLVHRQEWVERFGPIPKGMKVLHMCDNPPCRNYEHLYLGTQTDNMRDRSRRGRHSNGDRKGSKHPMARLTEDQARAILQRMGNGQKQKDVAAEFGVKRQVVGSIWSGKAWSHLLQEV